MTTLVEKQTIKVILLKRELNKARELAQKQKKQSRKRIKLEGEFVYNTIIILKVVKEAEVAILAKKEGKKPKKAIIDFIIYILTKEKGLRSDLGNSKDNQDKLG